jgi:hypothetical protein
MIFYPANLFNLAKIVVQTIFGAAKAATPNVEN